MPRKQFTEAVAPKSVFPPAPLGAIVPTSDLPPGPNNLSSEDILSPKSPLFEFYDPKKDYLPDKIPGKVGRKLWLNPRRIKVIEELLLWGNAELDVAEAVGISFGSFVNWMKIGRQISELFETLPEEWNLDIYDSRADKLKALELLERDVHDIIFYDFYKTVTKAKRAANILLYNTARAGSANDPYLAFQIWKHRNAETPAKGRGGAAITLIDSQMSSLPGSVANVNPILAKKEEDNLERLRQILLVQPLQININTTTSNGQTTTTQVDAVGWQEIPNASNGDYDE